MFLSEKPTLIHLLSFDSSGTESSKTQKAHVLI